MNVLMEPLTAEQVNEGFTNALFAVFSGAWNIIAPFAAAAVVLLLIILLLRQLISRKR